MYSDKEVSYRYYFLLQVFHINFINQYLKFAAFWILTVRNCWFETMVAVTSALWNLILNMSSREQKWHYWKPITALVQLWSILGWAMGKFNYILETLGHVSGCSPILSSSITASMCFTLIQHTATPSIGEFPDPFRYIVLSFFILVQADLWNPGSHQKKMLSILSWGQLVIALKSSQKLLLLLELTA